MELSLDAIQQCIHIQATAKTQAQTGIVTSSWTFASAIAAADARATAVAATAATPLTAIAVATAVAAAFPAAAQAWHSCSSQAHSHVWQAFVHCHQQPGMSLLMHAYTEHCSTDCIAHALHRCPWPF